MNRKDGGKGGRGGREPSAGARKKTSGNGGREEAGKSGGKEERGQGWRQGGTRAGRRRFSEFFGVKREKKRDNCLISNKNH